MFDGSVSLFLGQFSPLLMLLSFIAMAFVVYMASAAKEDLRVNVKDVPTAILCAIGSITILLGCLYLRDAITQWIDQHASEIAAHKPITLSNNQALYLPYLRAHITMWSVLTAYVTKTYWDHAVRLTDPIVAQASANVPAVRRDRFKSQTRDQPRTAARAFWLVLLTILLSAGSYNFSIKQLGIPGILWSLVSLLASGWISRSALKRSGHSKRWGDLMQRAIIVSFGIAVIANLVPHPLLTAACLLTSVFSIFMSFGIVAVCHLPRYNTERMRL